MRRKAKQARALATIDAILTAAAQVLERVGYKGATMDKLAKRAGLSVGTIYQYYENKDAVLEDLFDACSERLLKSLSDLRFDAGRTPAEQLSDFILIGGRNPDLSPDLFRELARAPRFKERTARFTERVEEATASFIGDLRPEMTAAQRRRKARIIVIAAQGLGSLSSRAELDDGLLEEFLRMVNGYVLDEAREDRRPDGAPNSRS